jgi:hypothetical protein
VRKQSEALTRGRAKHRGTLRAWLCVALVGLGLVGLAAGGAEPPPDVELFTRAGCRWCGGARAVLDEMVREQPGLRVSVHDVEHDPTARARLQQLATAHGLAAGVPAFLVGGELIIGFPGAEATKAALRARLAGAGTPGASVDVPLLGPVSVARLGLPAFTVLLGLLDGFNPCAMWVLLFVLALLVNLHDRVRMLAIGGVFVAVSGLAYFAFMAAWLNVFLLIGTSRAVELVLGLVAALIGALNVKDFVAAGVGPSLGIPAAARPGIYARVRRIVTAESLAAALATAAVLAVLVNVVELACTAGLPAVFTHELARQGLPAWQGYAYLGLYIGAYMLDDAVVLTVAVVTLGRAKLGERGGRWLKLLSGLVMLGLGAALLAGVAARARGA